MSKFEQRYCAFIDILGFSKRIESLEKAWDEQAYDRLRSCLRFMHDEQFESAYSADLPIYVEENGHLLEKELGDPRLTYVSDCLVISTARTSDGFKALCRKTTKIWIDLLWDGYLCRGGISAGPLIHEPSCVMGSAYMKAYPLEATASVPRVVIDKGLTEIYDAFPSVFPAHPPTMERADDGFLYLRYFPFNFYPRYVPTWTDYLLRARDHIVSGLQHEYDNVRRKYEFAKDEFNFAVEFYRKFLEPVIRLIRDDG